MLLSGIFQVDSILAQSPYLSDMTPLIVKCLELKDGESCINAVKRLENAQRHAASQGKYSCQTHLLGLEADLIMTILNEDRLKSAKFILQEIGKLCNEI